MAARNASSGGGSDDTGGTGHRRREAIRAAARRPSLALRQAADPARSQPADRAAKRAQDQAPVFISYARADLEIVRPQVVRLREAGAAVTWDQDFLGGADFEAAICAAIDVASAVVVVWSPASVRSAFVRDEARRALKMAKLITTYAPGFEMADVPLGFGHLHAIPVEDHKLVRRSLAQHGVNFRG